MQIVYLLHKNATYYGGIQGAKSCLPDLEMPCFFMTIRSVKISPQVNEKQRCRRFYGTFSDRPNGITKRMDATVADRGVCRRRGASSSLDRAPSVTNDIVAFSHMASILCSYIGPPQGQGCGRPPAGQIPTVDSIHVAIVCTTEKGGTK